MFRLSQTQLKELARGTKLRICVPALATDEEPEKQALRMLDVNPAMVAEIACDQEIEVNPGGASRASRDMPEEVYGSILHQTQPRRPEWMPPLVVVCHVVTIQRPIGRRGAEFWYQWPGHWRTGLSDFDDCLAAVRRG